MSARFGYVLDKISAAEITRVPFEHFYIENLFSESDFAEIVTSQEIDMRTQPTDEFLFKALFENGYRIIDFPGCITDVATYIKWHESRDQYPVLNNEACAGFGVTLRLMETKSTIMAELREFINSREMQSCLADKYKIKLDEVSYDCGIQKYLDGYEISPHPDIRRKALTYMVNINPGKVSEKRKHHTHYMRFDKSHSYVQSFWEGNPEQDRCWVPWDWCETVKEQVANNSLVIFAPANDTMHGVKASYDHLNSQRTQLYGNLWWKHNDWTGEVHWKQLSFQPYTPRKDAPIPVDRSMVGTLKAMMPARIKRAIKTAMGKNKDEKCVDNKNFVVDRWSTK